MSKKIMDNFMFFVVLFAGIGLGFAFGFLAGSYWNNQQDTFKKSS